MNRYLAVSPLVMMTVSPVASVLAVASNTTKTADTTVAAAAQTSADLNIHFGDNVEPPEGEGLTAGEEYEFEIPVGYELPEGASGTIEFYLADAGGRTLTRDVTGTGEYETTTFSFSATVPRSAAGDTFDLSATLNDQNGDFLAGDDEAYEVTTSGEPPEIIDVTPSGDDTIVVTKGETQRFSVDATDPDGDDIAYTWRLKRLGSDEDFRTVGSGNSHQQTFDPELEDGPVPYRIVVDIEDSGHSVSHEWLVDVQRENQDRSPTVSRVSPDAGDFAAQNGESVEFEIEASDPDADLERVEWYVGGSEEQTRFFGADQTQTDTWTYTFGSDEAGPVTARVFDQNGNTAEVQWGRAYPDLRVTNLELDPANPTAGETVQFRLTIENAGDAPADTIESAVRVGDELAAVPPTTSLEPGESTTTAWTGSYEFSGGQQAITGAVDPDDAIAETDESNNQASQTVSTETTDGELTVTALNANGETVQGASIVLYRSTDSGWSEVGTKETDSSGTVSWAELDSGEYNLELYGPDGDYWGTKTGIVMEENSTSVQIAREAPRVTNVDVASENDDGAMVVDETVTVAPTVQNDGPERPVRVQIRIDTDGDGTADIDETRGGQSSTVVSSGETQGYGYDFVPSSAGVKRIRVVTEVYLRDDWERTDDTGWEEQFEVAETDTDATVTNFDIQSGTYTPGDRVEATVTVENTGKTQHTFYTGYSFIGPEGNQYDNEGSTDQSVTLDPGATATVDVSWTVPEDATAGQYDSVAAVWQSETGDGLSGQLDTVERSDVVQVDRPDQATIVGYDPQTQESSNYTVSRESEDSEFTALSS